MTADRESFGDLLRRLRSAAALSQEALAERASLSKRGISDLERGARQVPRLETARLLADALGLGEADRQALLAAARPPVQGMASARPAGPSPQGLIPLPPTRLIGREHDVATLCALLGQQDVRLATLTGPGGTGKTHLAVTVAAEVAARYPDGVCFVDLSPITDPALVVPTIAAALGVREIAGESMRERLSRSLRDQRLLLVLDNCEQVLESAADIAALLAGCPHLAILATSREPLHIRAECEIAVSPLPLPDPARLPPLAELGHVPAVALFVERAHAVSAGFTLTMENAPAVAAICQRLDGLPLALELAAARVKVLPPAALLARLEQRLLLLTGGGRDVPARQRTMRNAIAWSHDFLTQEEQTLFRRLAVFPGGCTIEAAEVVASGEETVDVFAGLTSLVDKNLLRQDEGEDGEPRFRMLETIREFALERLSDSGEESATRDRHAGFFLALLDRHDVEDADPGWLDVIAREHDNLRAALEWSWEVGDHDTLIRLAGALAIFWYYRGYLTEGRCWLDQALQTPPVHAAPRPRAWAFTESGMLANVCGETDRATALLMESFSWWERSGEAYGYAIARSLLGGVWVNQGRYDEAADLFAANEAYFRDNEAVLRDAGHEDWLAIADFHLGLIAWVQGDDARARRLLRDAVDRYYTPAGSIDPLRYLGLIACAAGELDEAAMWFGAVVTRLRQHGSRAAIAVGLADVATLAAAREAWQPAARLFAKAEALLQAEAAAFSLPARDHYERAHAQARQALGDAAYQATTSAGRALTLEQALAEAEAVLVLDGDGRADAIFAPQGGRSVR
jgi:predicted ATPase/DNA-binding XRE family transcriptional regulator